MLKQTFEPQRNHAPHSPEDNLASDLPFGCHPPEPRYHSTSTGIRQLRPIADDGCLPSTRPTMNRPLSCSDGNPQQGRKVVEPLTRSPKHGWVEVAISQALSAWRWPFLFSKNPNPVLPNLTRPQATLRCSGSVHSLAPGWASRGVPQAPGASRLFHGEPAPRTGAVFLLFFSVLPRVQALCPWSHWPLVLFAPFLSIPATAFLHGAKHCVTLDRIFPFFVGKRKSFVSVANLFPFLGLSSGLLFGGFWVSYPSRTAQHCWAY